MSWTLPDHAEARRVRNTIRTHVNRDINIHRGIDTDADHHYRRRHAVATAVGVAAVAAVTAAVIGSIVYSLPHACSTVVVGGISYYNCSGTWYQPQYVGTQVSYVVVNPPR